MAIFDRKDDYLYVRWAQAVKKRDFYCCQICGQVGGNLNAHHKNGWNAFPDQRYDVCNGTTLCNPCHEQFHSVYGKGGNTEEQFDEFVKFCNILMRTSDKKIGVEHARNKLLSKLKDGYT